MNTLKSMIAVVSTDILRNKLTVRERAELLCNINALIGTFYYTVKSDNSHINEAEMDILKEDAKTEHHKPSETNVSKLLNILNRQDDKYFDVNDDGDGTYVIDFNIEFDTKESADAVSTQLNDLLLKHKNIRLIN